MMYALLVALHLCRATITEVNGDTISATTESGDIYAFCGDGFDTNENIVLVMDDLGHVINAF